MATSCNEQFGELISAYCDDELTPDELPTLEAHLQVCSDCRIVVEQFRNVDRRLLGVETQTTGSVSAKPGLSSQNHPIRSKRRLWLAVAMTSAAILLVGLTIFWPSNRPSPEFDLSIPTVDLNSIERLNQSTRDLSDDKIRSMELQLRVMLMEARQMQADNPEGSQFVSEIESMLASCHALSKNDRPKPE